MTKFYRIGAIGSFLDEYERAISDLQHVIAKIPDQELTIIIDPVTTDENCKSFQAILSHVVHSAYGYATSIHNYKGPQIQRPIKTAHLTIKAYLEDLVNVFVYTETVFVYLKDLDLEQHDDALKIKAGWGQSYDIEQMMEHAIVHVLRHRRQIERLMA
jgi:uncharacterized damage-inducible protein DinB